MTIILKRLALTYISTTGLSGESLLLAQINNLFQSSMGGGFADLVKIKEGLKALNASEKAREYLTSSRTLTYPTLLHFFIHNVPGSNQTVIKELASFFVVPPSGLDIPKPMAAYSKNLEKFLSCFPK